MNTGIFIVDLDFDRTPPRFGQQQIEVGENPKPRRIIKETHSLCSGCLQILHDVRTSTARHLHRGISLQKQKISHKCFGFLHVL